MSPRVVRPRRSRGPGRTGPLDGPAGARPTGPDLSGRGPDGSGATPAISRPHSRSGAPIRGSRRIPATAALRRDRPPDPRARDGRGRTRPATTPGRSCVRQVMHGSTPGGVRGGVTRRRRPSRRAESAVPLRRLGDAALGWAGGAGAVRPRSGGCRGSECGRHGPLAGTRWSNSAGSGCAAARCGPASGSASASDRSGRIRLGRSADTTAGPDGGPGSGTRPVGAAEPTRRLSVDPS